MISLEFIDIPPTHLDTNSLSSWINTVLTTERKSMGNLSIVIGSDDWLLQFNKQHLNHDYYTDIITFDYTTNNLVSGDLLISLERVFDNATTLNVSRETELHRVIIHGVLHLCGYADKSLAQQKIMREKEDYYLTLL